MWLIVCFLLILSCTPKFKEIVFKRYKDKEEGKIVFFQKGNFYPKLDEESYKYVVITSKTLHMPIPKREEIRKALIKYLKNKGFLLSSFQRLSMYESIVVPIIRRYGLPEELKFLPVIESGYNPSAVSRAGAAGLWQFMPQTAKRYGLRINKYIDERFDVIKSTEAAARYLRDLYKTFGNWELALAAYHCGEGCVARRAGSDFWLHKENLPRETRRYVPSFFGILLLYKYPNKYGLRFEPSSKPIRYMYIRENKLVKALLRELGLPAKEFRKLNPHVKGDIILKGCYVYFK